MIVSQVWDGTRFINTDSDTVDGYHANELAASGAVFKRNVFQNDYSIWKFIAEEDTRIIDLPSDIWNEDKVEQVYNSTGERLNPIDHYTLIGSRISLSSPLSRDNFLIIYIIDSSYDFNDLINKPNVGNLLSLSTTNKDTIVDAINEVNGKIQKTQSDLTDSINKCLEGKADKEHSHTNVHYTKEEINQKLNAKSNTTHNHNGSYAAPIHHHNEQSVLEVGQYIDMHKSGSTADYDTRIYVDNNNNFRVVKPNGFDMDICGEITALKSGGGGGVKLVQRGVTTGAQTVTIQAVNMNKTVVHSVSKGSAGYVAARGNIASSKVSGSHTAYALYNSGMGAARVSDDGTRSFSTTGTVEATSLSGGTTDLTVKMYSAQLISSTQIKTDGPCEWQVVEYY